MPTLQMMEPQKSNTTMFPSTKQQITAPTEKGKQTRRMIYEVINNKKNKKTKLLRREIYKWTMHTPFPLEGQSESDPKTGTFSSCSHKVLNGKAYIYKTKPSNH